MEKVGVIIEARKGVIRSKNPTVLSVELRGWYVCMDKLCKLIRTE